MIDVITKIFCALFCGYAITYVSIKIGKPNYNLKKLILSTLFIGGIIYGTYAVNYKSEILILKIVLFIIIIKYIFNMSVYKSVITILISIILTSIGEIISSIVLIKIATINEVRTNNLYILICNIMICLLMIFIVKIKYIQSKLSNFIAKTDGKSKISTIILFTSSVLIMTYLFYNISVNYHWNEKYIITILIMVSYVIISLIFFKDKLEYNMLEEKYDALFEYFSEIAESIDDLNLTTHEYKNQIAIVGNYIENKKYKKAKDYIDDISKTINKDEVLLVNLTDIPTGGLKGLLYYKIIVAKNQKVEIVLDVGNNTNSLFKKLDEERIKIITRIIGVYLDNAISESSKTNKMINIEIYNLDDNIVFAISNKIEKNININNIGKKGYTTKGKGHGQGLYLVNRLISRNKWLKSENKVVNNYYVTKLIVTTKNIGK